MLVLSRERGQSIMVDGPDSGSLITVLEVRESDVSLLISHSPAKRTLDSWTVKLKQDAKVKVGILADVTLIDIRQEKIRLGFDVPKETTVHRLEVYEAIRRKADDEDGLAGSPVPRPDNPKPPSLDVRLDEPPVDEGG